MTYRTEHDSMGEVRVPADRYWGAQTERSRNNFPIGAGRETMPEEIIRAFAILKKAAALDIRIICPLHGPVLQSDLPYYLDLYNTWTSYGVESEGIAVCYTSVYGNTEKAVQYLAERLKAKGCPKVAVSDLARSDMAECVEDAFRYGRLVLATTTYNADIFPFMRTFIETLAEHGFRGRKIGLMENGSWAPTAAKVMKGLLEGCKEISFAETTVKILSSLSEENKAQIEALADEMMQ